MHGINFPLIRKWIERGAPDIDTLSAMMGVYSLNLIKVVSGKIPANAEIKSLLADAFGCKISEIFPEDKDQDE